MRQPIAVAVTTFAIALLIAPGSAHLSATDVDSRICNTVVDVSITIEGSTTTLHGATGKPGWNNYNQEGSRWTVPEGVYDNGTWEAHTESIGYPAMQVGVHTPCN